MKNDKALKQWMVSVFALGWLSGCNAPDSGSMPSPMANAHIDGDNSRGNIRVDASNNCAVHPVLKHTRVHVRKVMFHSRDDDRWYQFQQDGFDFDVLNPGNSLSNVFSRGSCDERKVDRVRIYTDDQGDADYNDGRHGNLQIVGGSDLGMEFSLDQDLQIQRGALAILRVEFDTLNSFSFNHEDDDQCEGNHYGWEHGNDVMFKPYVRAHYRYSDRDDSDDDDRYGDRDDSRSFVADRDRDHQPPSVCQAGSGSTTTTVVTTTTPATTTVTTTAPVTTVAPAPTTTVPTTAVSFPPVVGV